MIKNKIYALALMGLGWAALKLSNDATFLVMISFVAVPMFFSKREWIY